MYTYTKDGGSDVFLPSTTDVVAGDVFEFKFFPACGDVSGQDTTLEGECMTEGCNHWVARLALKMCEMEDIGDWSGACVTDHATGEQKCADDTALFNNPGYFGANNPDGI